MLGRQNATTRPRQTTTTTAVLSMALRFSRWAVVFYVPGTQTFIYFQF